MSTEPPDVGIVVVSHNTRDLLDRCLQSLAREIDALGGEATVWVVDNASTDGSPDLVARRHPWVSLVAEETNLGYAGGANRLLRPWAATPVGGPRLVLVMNPDTELEPGALRALSHALEAAPGAAVAGPQLIYPDGTFQHSAFRFPGLVQTALDLFPVARLTDTTWNGRYRLARYEAGVPFSVDFPLGACMLVRQKALAVVGPMDDGFHMYSEEIDWCRRFHDAGFACLCVPGARVVHHAGASTRQVRSAMLSQLWRSRLRYFSLHEQGVRRRVLVGAVPVLMRGRTWVDRAAVALGRMAPDDAAARAAAFDAALGSGRA